MRRDGLNRKEKETPLLRPILHECIFCKKVGIKPDILGTKYGDYGAREYVRKRYEELELNENGLCEDCQLIQDNE